MVGDVVGSEARARPPPPAPPSELPQRRRHSGGDCDRLRGLPRPLRLALLQSTALVGYDTVRHFGAAVAHHLRPRSICGPQLFIFEAFGTGLLARALPLPPLGRLGEPPLPHLL